MVEPPRNDIVPLLRACMTPDRLGRGLAKSSSRPATAPNPCFRTG
jgi:hypothetical protein